MSWQFNPCCPCCPEKNIFQVKKFNAEGEIWHWPGSKPQSSVDVQTCVWYGDSLYLVCGTSTRPICKFPLGKKRNEFLNLSGVSAHQTGSGEPSCIVQDKAMVTIEDGTHIQLRRFNGDLIVSQPMGTYHVQRHFFNHQCMWSQPSTNLIVVDPLVLAWDGDGNQFCNINMYDYGYVNTQVSNVSGGILFIEGVNAIRISDGAILPFISAFNNTNPWYGFTNDKVLMGGNIYDHSQTVIGSFAPYQFGTYSPGFYPTNKYGYFFDGEFFGMVYKSSSVAAERVVGVGWFDELGSPIKLIDELDFSDWFNPWSDRIPCDIRITPNGKRYVIGICWNEDLVARPGITLFDENKEVMYQYPYITPDNKFNDELPSGFPPQYINTLRGVTVDDADNTYYCSQRFNFS